MKIDAYNEQKKAAALYEEQNRKLTEARGSISGAALTQAAAFIKTDNSLGLFAASGYAAEGADTAKMPKSIEEFAGEAQALLDNMKAICNRMDTGELVAMEDGGVDVNDMDADKLVTVGEQIRIKLAVWGNEHVYTEDLDEADLKSVLGNENAALAARVLSKYNLPQTEDNINEISRTISMAEELKEPDVMAESYLMNNSLAPTVWNLYRAEYASGRGQAEGRLTDGQWNELRPQMEGLLSEAGIEPSAEVLEEMRQLVNLGTAMTKESLDIYRQTKEAGEFIQGLSLNNNEMKGASELFKEALADKAAAVMVDGEEAKQVNLSDEPALWKKAAEAVAVLERVTAGALYEFLQNDSYERSLEGLEGSIENVQPDASDRFSLNPLDYYNLSADILTDERSIHTLRCLEELRLKMTFEAAYILEKNGMDVNTEELGRLVEELGRLELSGAGAAGEDAKGQEDSRNEGANGPVQQMEDDRGRTDYRRFMYELGVLKGAPAAAIGAAVNEKEMQGQDRIALADLEIAAIRLQKRYADAGETYETMSTQIRPDLGDRIGSAVSASTENVLKELELDSDEENKRAVRILAYNSMEITRERIDRVKAVDGAVNMLFDRMTPDIALELLRAGTDIMNMSIEELSQEVEERRQNRENISTEKFSEFLYEQEKKGRVDASDREQFMALYTIINKLSKDNGRAAGQLVNQNMDATLGNLVTSYMIGGAAGIAASASDEGAEYEQSREHNNARLASYKELLSRLSSLPRAAAELVTENGIPGTINNLAAAGALYEDNAYYYKEIKKTDVNADLDRFIRNMDSKGELLESFKELSEQLKEAVDTAGEDGGVPDIALLKQLSKGMSFMESLARQNTFYVPYDSERGTRAIRLSVVEDTKTAGSFTVDMDMEDGSHVNISARVQEDELTAYIMSQSDREKELDSIKAGLYELGFSRVRLTAAKSGQPLPHEKGVSGRTETRKLFAAAKVFVENFR